MNNPAALYIATVRFQITEKLQPSDTRADNSLACFLASDKDRFP